MRVPRPRFTIGRLMVVVLLAGLVLWGARVIRVRRLNQAIVESQALANYQQAKLVREVAEHAVKEYEQGIYSQDKATYLGQIALAKSDQERAIDRLQWSTKMVAKGFVSKATNIADQLTLQQANFDLEQARTQLMVLETYTKQKQMKSLWNDVEKALAIEKTKQEAYQLERVRRSGLLGF